MVPGPHVAVAAAMHPVSTCTLDIHFCHYQPLLNQAKSQLAVVPELRGTVAALTRERDELAAREQRRAEEAAAAMQQRIAERHELSASLDGMQIEVAKATSCFRLKS